MKPYVVALTIIVLTLVSIPVEASGTPVNQWNPIEDIINKIKEAILSAFNWLVDQLNGAFWGAVGPLLRALSKLVLGNPVPEYADWGPVENVSWYEIRVPEMLGLYDKAKLVAYALLPLPIVLGALSIGLESFGLVMEGEGMLMVKKSLWTAILIPLSMILYGYSVHLLSAITYYLCPPDTLSWYLGISSGSMGVLAIIIDPLILLFILVVAIAGAVRILAVATLAAILPILLVLSLVPKINRIATMLIETLIALTLAQPVAGAMITMAAAIAMGIPGSSLEDSIVKIMIAIASLTIPLIAPMLIGRSGFASFAASTLLGYTVYPAVRVFRGYILASTFGSGTFGLGLNWGIKAGIKMGRYIYRGATALPRLPRIIRTKYENYQFTRNWDKLLYEEYES